MKKLITIAIFLLAMNAVNAMPVKVTDTIAGYSSLIKSSKTFPNTDMMFKIEKPNGSNIKIQSRTDKNGYAIAEFDGFHTKQAGLYKVSAALNNTIFENNTTFKVFSDVFSPTKSYLSADKSSLAAKQDTLVINVTVKDKYGNNIPNQLIKLFSSRNEDKITENNNISNEKGQVSFSIKSLKEGVSVFTAINQSINQEILQRQKIVFYKQEEKQVFGGNLFSANLIENQETIGTEFGVLDHFEVEFPDTAEVNSDQNHLTVIAKDVDNNTVESYTGTIIIETNDENAIIPNEGEYTFTERDMGIKKFDLSIIFSELGNKTITVYDFDENGKNKNLKGEKNIIIQEKKDDMNIADISNELIIKSPIDGSEISQSTINISGLAPKNTKLKIMMDDVKRSEVISDESGFFVSEIPNMEDGNHVLYIIEDSRFQRVSKTISFSIDATPPSIDSIDVFPETNLYTEKAYIITVYSEPNLDFVKIRVNGMETELIESPVTKGKYEATLTSPLNPGDYSIDFILNDGMQNKAEYRNQKTLNVSVEIIIMPEAPLNLLATSGDKIIDLTWKAPSSQRKITKYNVYIGESAYSLKQITESISTSARITNLENDKEYFISVSAVDEENIEGNQSHVISATAKKEIEIIHTVAPVKTKPLRAIAGNSTVTLSWDAFPQAAKYKIMFGVKPNQYETAIITKNNALSYVVEDLINDVNYYFSISAIDENGFEISNRYDYVKSLPNGYGFKIVQSNKFMPKYNLPTTTTIKGETGPETTLFILISLILTAGFFILKKKNKTPLNIVQLPINCKLQF